MVSWTMRLLGVDSIRGGQYLVSSVLAIMEVVVMWGLIRGGRVLRKGLIPAHLLKPSEVIQGILLAILIYLISNYVNVISQLFFKNQMGDLLSGVEASGMLSFFSIALVPAFCEEFMFRGCIYHGVLQTEPGAKKKAVLVSAITFALLHMNFNQMVYAFAAGLLMALILTARDNIVFTMLIHFLFNSMTLLIILFQGKLTELGEKASASDALRGVSASSLAPMTTAAVIALGLYLLIYWNLKRGRREESKTSKGHYRPDLIFLVGCVVCIVMACLVER